MEPAGAVTACVTAVTAGAGDWPQLGGGGDGRQARQQELPVLSVLVGLEPVAGHLVHALSVGVMVAGPVVDDSLMTACMTAVTAYLWLMLWR